MSPMRTHQKTLERDLRGIDQNPNPNLRTKISTIKIKPFVIWDEI